jgi:hypothetical protein
VAARARPRKRDVQVIEQPDLGDLVGLGVDVFLGDYRPRAGDRRRLQVRRLIVAGPRAADGLAVQRD